MTLMEKLKHLNNEGKCLIKNIKNTDVYEVLYLYESISECNLSEHRIRAIINIAIPPSPHREYLYYCNTNNYVIYICDEDVEISEAIREYIFNTRDDFQEIFGKHRSEIDKVVESAFKDTKFYTKK
jgi:hypothetical protein